MPTFTNRSIATFGAIVATFVTVAAATPLRAETGQARVRYADLDLRSAKGMDTLDRRINAAAERVCAPTDAAMRLRALPCIRSAVASAKASLPVVHDAIQIAAR